MKRAIISLAAFGMLLLAGIASAAEPVAAGAAPAAASAAPDASPAPAPASKRVIGVYIEGADQAAGREAIDKVVPEGVTVADPAAVEEVLKRGGVATPLASRLATEKSRKALAAKLGKELGASQLDALIVAGTMRAKKGKRVVVLVVGASSAAPLASGNYDLRKTDALEGALSPPLSAFARPSELAKPAADERALAPAPPAAPVESDVPAPVPRPNASEARADGGERNPFRDGVVIAELHGGGAGRDYGYKGLLTPRQRSYSLTAAPRAGVSVEVYPLAGTSTAVLRNLGVVAAYDRSFGISSKLEGQPALDSTWYSYKLGLRARQPLGTSGLVAVEGAYLRNAFSFSGDDPVAVALSPSVDYKAARIGVDGRFDIGRLGLVAGVAYQIVSDVGGVSQSFPHARAAGVDAALGVSVRIASGLDARLRFTYARYFFDLGPEVGDAFVAGGALDQMFGLQAGVAFAQ